MHSTCVAEEVIYAEEEMAHFTAETDTLTFQEDAAAGIALLRATRPC